MNRPLYKFSIYVFSSAEIDQICSLVRLAGKSSRIDRRCYTRQVLDFALARRLIVWRCAQCGAISNYHLPFAPLAPCGQCGRKIFHLRAATSGYRLADDLPVEALWRLVDPIIGPDSGFSISRKRAWHAINVWTTAETTPEAAELGWREQFAIFCRLAEYKYIDFQAAGSIWQITRRPPSDRLPE